MTDEQEPQRREAFEAWWTRVMNVEKWPLTLSSDPLHYLCDETDRGWMAWYWSAAQAQPAPQPCDCGEPDALGYVHGIDPPCYREDAAAETDYLKSISAFNPLRNAQQEQPPQGWKLVPIEPTPEQQDAGFAVQGSGSFNHVYRAMIAAAPIAQQEKPPLKASCLVPDSECVYGKCTATTTGCWDACANKISIPVAVQSSPAQQGQPAFSNEQIEKAFFAALKKTNSRFLWRDLVHENGVPTTDSLLFARNVIDAAIAAQGERNE